MAAASSIQHTPVRAATPDLIATYNIGATSDCMSKSKKGWFEQKLEVDLTKLLQVCCNKRPFVGLLRYHDKLACLLVLCFALLVSVLVLLCFICFASLCLPCLACSLAWVLNARSAVAGCRGVGIILKVFYNTGGQCCLRLPAGSPPSLGPVHQRDRWLLCRNASD